MEVEALENRPLAGGIVGNGSRYSLRPHPLTESTFGPLLAGGRWEDERGTASPHHQLLPEEPYLHRRQEHRVRLAVLRQRWRDRESLARQVEKIVRHLEPHTLSRTDHPR